METATPYSLMLRCFLAGACLALAGCSSTTAADPAPSSNEKACTDFAEAQNTVVRYQFDGKGSMSLDDFLVAEKAAQDRLDTIGLQAEGDVRVRISTLTSELPAKSRDLGTRYSISTAFNENSQRVARACEAEGFHIQVGALPKIPSSMN